MSTACELDGDLLRTLEAEIVVENRQNYNVIAAIRPADGRFANGRRRGEQLPRDEIQNCREFRLKFFQFCVLSQRGAGGPSDKSRNATQFPPDKQGVGFPYSQHDAPGPLRAVGGDLLLELGVEVADAFDGGAAESFRGLPLQLPFLALHSQRGFRLLGSLTLAVPLEFRGIGPPAFLASRGLESGDRLRHRIRPIDRIAQIPPTGVNDKKLLSWPIMPVDQERLGMNAGEIPDANGERRGLELHSVLRMQGGIGIRRQNDGEASAWGEMVFQNSERRLKILP